MRSLEPHLRRPSEKQFREHRKGAILSKPKPSLGLGPVLQRLRRSQVGGSHVDTGVRLLAVRVCAAVRGIWFAILRMQLAYRSLKCGEGGAMV